MTQPAYNQAQLQEDLRAIVNVFGERVLCGFYTQGSYINGKTEIIDVYNSSCTITHKGHDIDLISIDPQSRFGEWIMLKAMEACNARDRRIDVDITYA